MQSKIAELREVVQKLVPLLTGKGLEVTQRGSQAYVRTDPVTRKPTHVNIPNITDNASDSFVRAVQGFIDHEVAHVLITDWNFYGGGPSPEDLERPAVQKLMNTHNIIEDTMIEREIVHIFPGSKKNIADLREHFLRKITTPAIAKARSDEEKFNYLLVPTMRALAGHVEMQEFMDENGYWEHPMVEKLVGAFKPETLELLRTANTTEQTLVVARELYTILYKKEDEPQSEPQGEPQDGDEGESQKDQSQDKPDQKAGEGDGDGERDHSETENGETGDAEGAEGAEGEDENDGGESGKSQGEDDAEGAEEEGETEGGGSDSGDAEDDADDEGDAGADGPDKPDGDTDEDADAPDGEGDDGDEGEPDAGDDADAGSDESGDDGDDAADADGDTDADDGTGDQKGSGGADGEQDDSGESDDEGSVGEIKTDGATDDGDPGEITGNDEESDGGSGVGSAEGKSMFDFEEDALEGRGIAEEMMVQISEEAVDAIEHSDWSVFSREWDQIKPLEPPENMNSSWVPNMDDDVRAMTGRMQKDIERIMASQSHVVNTPGHKRGRLHAASLYRVSQGDPRVFTQKQEHRSKDTAVTLLVDNSGSMSGAKMTAAMLSAYALSTTLNRVGIAHEMIGFTTGNWSMPQGMMDALREEQTKASVDYDRVIPLVMPIYKAFDERLDATVKKRVAYAMNAQHGLLGNIDGESLMIAAERLARRSEKRKVMLVLSDGQPAGGRNSGSHLKGTVKHLNKNGIETIGIGILTDAVSRYYDNHVVLRDVKDLPGQVMTEIKRVLS